MSAGASPSEGTRTAQTILRRVAVVPVVDAGSRGAPRLRAAPEAAPALRLIKPARRVHPVQAMPVDPLAEDANDVDHALRRQVFLGFLSLAAWVAGCLVLLLWAAVLAAR